MEETLRLIRLLVEAPAEEPMLERPAELRDRIKMDEAARVAAPGVAGTPAAERQSRFELGPLARPAAAQSEFGAVADPKTALPVVEYKAVVKPLAADDSPQADVRSPQQSIARSATPALVQAISSAPASIKGAAVESSVQAAPKTTVTIVAPAAFPIDMKAAFEDADATLGPDVVATSVHGYDPAFPQFEVPETSAEYSARSYGDGTQSDMRRVL